MRQKLLLTAMAAMMTLGAGAQQKVSQYFRVSDSNFNVHHADNEDNLNSYNPLQNVSAVTLTLVTESSAPFHGISEAPISGNRASTCQSTRNWSSA